MRCCLTCFVFQEYVQSLSRRGHLNLLCSLHRFEESLRSCIRDPSHPLNVLFVWESQICILIRVAQTAAGTLLLTQAGLLASLVDLSFIGTKNISSHFVSQKKKKQTKTNQILVLQ
jgi:hypothetical protein